MTFAKNLTNVAQPGRHHAFVVERVYANQVLMIRGRRTTLQLLELAFVHVRPAPYACVDDVRYSLAASYLQSTIQRSL